MTTLHLPPVSGTLCSKVIKPLPAAERKSLIRDICTCPSIAFVEVFLSLAEETPGAADKEREMEALSKTMPSFPPAADNLEIREVIPLWREKLTDKTAEPFAAIEPSMRAAQDIEHRTKNKEQKIAAYPLNNCFISYKCIR